MMQLGSNEQFAVAAGVESQENGDIIVGESNSLFYNLIIQLHAHQFNWRIPPKNIFKRARA